jgi:hypothetical protein
MRTAKLLRLRELWVLKCSFLRVSDSGNDALE